MFKFEIIIPWKPNTDLSVVGLQGKTMWTSKAGLTGDRSDVFRQNNRNFKK